MSPAIAFSSHRFHVILMERALQCLSHQGFSSLRMAPQWTSTPPIWMIATAPQWISTPPCWTISTALQWIWTPPCWTISTAPQWTLTEPYWMPSTAPQDSTGSCSHHRAQEIHLDLLLPPSRESWFEGSRLERKQFAEGDCPQVPWHREQRSRHVIQVLQRTRDAGRQVALSDVPISFHSPT